MAVNKQNQPQVETLVRKDSWEKSHVYYYYNYNNNNYYYYYCYVMVGLLAFNLFFVNILKSTLTHPPRDVGKGKLSRLFY